jgi:hypothetical protein
MNFKGLVLLSTSFVLGCGAVNRGRDPAEQQDAGLLEGVDSGFDADGTGLDAGLDAGAVDGGVVCDRPQACQLAWTEPDHFPVPLDHHTTFIHSSAAGTFLYAVGGVQNVGPDTIAAVYDDVRRAKIKADGSLEAWTEAGKLPIPLAFHSQATAGNRVYLLGGISKDAQGAYAHNRVFIGTIDETDGSISWVDGPRFNEAAMHATASIVGDRLYLVGGSVGDAPKDHVLVSTLGPDGRNGPWTPGATLPQARSHHTAIVHEGRLFLIGGFDAAHLPLHEILKSEHDATGAITGWKVGGDLPNAPWTAGASLLGDSVFIVGGGEGGPAPSPFVDRVRRARFYPNNTLQPFEDVSMPLPTPRAHVHQAPIFNGRIYSVGGRLYPSYNTMDRVFIGTFKE